MLRFAGDHVEDAELQDDDAEDNEMEDEVEDDEVEDDDAEENEDADVSAEDEAEDAAPQTCAARFARASAIEMRLDM